jgi:hypothetical protein
VTVAVPGYVRDATVTREQEAHMGAHSARPADTGPIAVARIATTTLAVAVTGTVGAGTALAHEDGSGHHGSDRHDHVERSVDAASAHGGTTAATAQEEAARARAEAQETVRDALADVGMSDGDLDAYGDDAADDDHSDVDDPDRHSDEGTAPEEHAAPAATPARPPNPPSSPSGRSTVQPIAASGNTGPSSDVPPPGESRTIPIR